MLNQMPGCHNFLLKFKSSFLRKRWLRLWLSSWAEGPAYSYSVSNSILPSQELSPIGRIAPVSLLPEYLDPFAVDDPIW